MCASDVISFCWKGLKPLLWCLKWLLIGLFGVVLLPLILALLMLFFTLKWMGVDVDSEWPIVLIIIVCLIALIWFCCHFCAGYIDMDFNGRKQWLLGIFGPLLGVSAGAAVPGGAFSYSAGVEGNFTGEVVGIAMRLESMQLYLVLPQLILLIILLLLFILLIQVWFIPFIGGFMLGLIFGGLAIAVLAYFTIKYVARAMSMNLNYLQDNPKDGLNFVLGIGFAITFLAMCIIYAFFLICYFITRFFLVDELNKEGLQKLNLILMGFMMGLILGAFVYRELPSILSRGLKTATFGLIKTESSIHLQNNYISIVTKVAYLFQGQVGYVVVSTIDSMLIILFLTCLSFAMFDHSAEMIAGGNKAIMSPFIYFIVTFFGAIVAYLLKALFSDDLVSTLTAVSCRWIIILQGIFAILVYGFFPVITVPKDGFSLKGSGTADIDTEGITVTGVIGCGVLGILTNLFIIALFEIYTSHGWPSVQNMSISSVPRILGMNVIFANYLGGLAGFLPVACLLTMFFIAYTIGGFAGILYFGSGYIALMLVLMPIFFLGASSNDSYRLTCLANFGGDVQDKVWQMAWAAKNYMIHLKVTNAGGAVLLSFVMIGCTMFLVGKTNNLFHRGLGAVGIILGAGLAFLIKGLNTCAVINLAKIYVPSFTSTYKDINQGGDIKDENYDELENYIYEKFFQSVFFVGMNILICSLFVLFNGGLFGIESAIGLTIGMTIACLFIMLTSLIQGTALENARIYNESNDSLDKRGRVYAAFVSGEVIGSAVDESNATPLLNYLLYVVVLTYCCSQSMNFDGLIPELVYGE